MSGIQQEIVTKDKAACTAFLRKGLPIARSKRLDGNTLHMKSVLAFTTETKPKAHHAVQVGNKWRKAVVVAKSCN
jgi:hypothetical protein